MSHRDALTPCSSCQRHVRGSATQCPFCGAARESIAVPQHRLAAPAVRLSRAALFALGTGSAALGGVALAGSSLVACSSDADDDPNNTVPLYGGPPVDSGADDAAKTDGPVMVDAAYGGPPVDAAVDAKADAGADAANDADSGTIGTLYGGPPADSGGGG